MVRRLVLAGLYLALYHWMYFTYIHPVFGYAHYDYIPRHTGLYVLGYVLALAPVLAYSNVMTPSNYGATLLYTMCYAPGLLTVLFMLNRSVAEVFFVMLFLSASMSAIFYCSSRFPVKELLNGSPRIQASGLRPIAKLTIFGLTVLGTLVAFYFNWGHMRLVGFEDVYELRFDAQDSARGGIFGYLILWLSVCFIPYYATIGSIGKSRSPLYFSIGLAIVVYMTNGAKSTLLLPLAVFVLSKLYVDGKDFFLGLLLVMSMAMGFFALVEVDGLEIFKSLLLVRTLATGGWNLTTYYDFFTSHELTYYTHIGVVKFLTEAYPYGNYSLGQMIGIEYSGSEDANFNANFWASDGFAAMGLLGIIPATLAVLAVMRIINGLSKPVSTRFVALWLTGFWMSLLNAPLSTSLLSGGGLIVLALLVTSRAHRPQAASEKLREPRDTHRVATSSPADIG
ncbi:MAG: hypothetical protein KF796_18270 [Ramlibacter sp.]|nr:hypothetical protein [Ramlibacter sp.]